MPTSEERIHLFEQKYMAKLRAWGGYVRADDLDELNTTLLELDQLAKELSIQMEHESMTLQRRWGLTLKNVLNLIPNIHAHCDLIRDEARQNLNLLEKGQKSLVGYRRAFSPKRSIFDQNG